MSTSNTATSTTKAPLERFNAFTCRQYDIGGEQRTDWMRVGTAFPHNDGKGFRIVLSAIPVDGVVVLRKVEEDEKGG